jgi:hypothetical protein
VIRLDVLRVLSGRRDGAWAAGVRVHPSTVQRSARQPAPVDDGAVRDELAAKRRDRDRAEKRRERIAQLRGAR